MLKEQSLRVFMEVLKDWRFENFYGGSMGFQGFVKVLSSFKGFGKVWLRLEKRRGRLTLKNSCGLRVFCRFLCQGSWEGMTRKKIHLKMNHRNELRILKSPFREGLQGRLGFIINVARNGKNSMEGNHKGQLELLTLVTKCHYFSRVDSIGKMELGS